MEKLPQSKVDEIIALAGARETVIAKRTGVSRWTVHHYLELAGKTTLGKHWLKPAPGSVVKKGTYAIYYNKSTARRGYPWVIESSEGTELAKSVDIIGPAVDFHRRTAWTSYDPNPVPAKRGGRPSYVRAVLMVHGQIVVHN
jgi:hypothetical protein